MYEKGKIEDADSPAMDDGNFFKICNILQDSETWPKEVLERVSPLFLLLRNMWLQSKEYKNKEMGTL